MSKKLKDKVVAICDFETETDGTKTQAKTEPWATAFIDIEAPDDPSSVVVHNCIEDWLEYIYEYKGAKIYFHNAKFDGNFILSYLLNHGYQPAIITEKDEKTGKTTRRYATKKEMQNDTLSTLISDKGIWYQITFKHKGHVYEIYDSYKILPFSVSTIGKSFGTAHKKLEIEYIGDMHAHGVITPEQEAYIKNDVLVVKEALQYMFGEGHTKMTIGSNCMGEFKKGYENIHEFNQLFPNLYGDNYRLTDSFGSFSAGDYIRNSYKGGWCYLKPEYANKHIKAHTTWEDKKIAGTTCDVNSLYPSMMHSMSGNRYPVGMPHFWKGEIPKDVINDNSKYYFIRVKTRFYIKDGFLPTIQIKHDPLYPARQWLTSSDYIDKQGNAYKSIEDDIKGGVIEMIPTLTLTMTDWQLLNKHYNLEDTQILDGCWFDTRIGLFDEYINHYAEIKKKSKGAARQLAKLFLNNLYGRFATSIDASYKVPFIGDDGVLHFYTESAQSIKKGAYIPIGAAITSYSRAFTITAAQKNYDTFVYSDTDSIHLLCTPDEVKGAPEDPVEFCHWKYEATWDEAIFVRAKTYIEHVCYEDREPVEPYYNLKCAGMPDRAKANFLSKIEQEPLKDEDPNEYAKKFGVSRPNPDEIAFYKSPKMSLTDYKIGLKVPGSLKPKSIKGGIVLINGEYVMRPNMF